jgi:cysteine desulfurase
MASTQPLYLDYAAATPVSTAVMSAMKAYGQEQFYNPSATYAQGRLAHNTLEAARTRVAHWIGARPSEIIFTAGGTEANNLAVHGVMRRFPEANVVVSCVEHESVLAPAGRYDCREAAVDSDGLLDLVSLEAQIDDKTVLVSVMYANNEIGTIQPLRQVTQLLHVIREQRLASGNDLPLYFHTDACQAANYLDLHAARLGVDLLTINGGKIYGPKQSGVLFVKGGVQLQPLIDGGGQERGLRSGTENVAQAVGLATALQLVQEQRQTESHRLQELQEQFFHELRVAIPTITFNGTRKRRLPNNVHVTLSGTDNERLLIQLDEVGIMAAAGSACSASNDEPSHVLRAIGLSDADAQSSLRFTLGQMTSESDITTVVMQLASLVA